MFVPRDLTSSNLTLSSEGFVQCEMNNQLLELYFKVNATDPYSPLFSLKYFLCLTSIIISTSVQQCHLLSCFGNKYELFKQ